MEEKRGRGIKVNVAYECGDCGCRFTVERSPQEADRVDAILTTCPDCSMPDNVVVVSATVEGDP